MRLFSCLILIVACLVLQPVQTNADSERKQVAFLSSIPARATLSQIKRLLPPGIQLGAARMQAPSDYSSDGWKWTYVPIIGLFTGKLIFANDRQLNLMKKLPKGWSSRLKYRQEMIVVGRWHTSDPVHGIVLFASLNPIAMNTNVIDATTKHSIKEVSSVLGTPTRTAYYHYDPNSDDPEGYHGYYAEWIRTNDKTIWTSTEFSNEVSTAETQLRLEIGLRFPYSHFYSP